MTTEFYRAQAALCVRIAKGCPQERIARELLAVAAEFDAQAAATDLAGGAAERETAAADA